MLRLTVPLETKEKEALFELAKNEFRDPRDQVRFIVRQELQRRGLLENNRQKETPIIEPGRAQ